MLFGYGMVHCKSSNQKLDKTISTEAKLVGVCDCLPYNIYIFLFMVAQGYSIKQNILFQYNHSEIKMDKTRKNLFTGNYRNIDIRYFFANDRVESNNMSIAYLITEHMLANIFTKYIQRSLYVKKLKLSWGGNM